MIFWAINNPNSRIGVFRKTLPALKKTSWLEIRKLLDSHGIEYEENRSPSGTSYRLPYSL